MVFLCLYKCCGFLVFIEQKEIELLKGSYIVEIDPYNKSMKI